MSIDKELMNELKVEMELKSIFQFLYTHSIKNTKGNFNIKNVRGIMMSALAFSL